MHDLDLERLLSDLSSLRDEDWMTPQLRVYAETLGFAIENQLGRP